MAIVTKQQILEAVRERFDGDESDEALSLIENLSDTLDDLENKTKDNTDWEKKYNDNDKKWREKYKARFFGASDDDDEDDGEQDETPKPLTFENLFKEEN